MNKLVSQIYNKDSNRDAQLMQVIREIQETKRMVVSLKRAKASFNHLEVYLAEQNKKKQMNKQYKIKVTFHR